MENNATFDELCNQLKAADPASEDAKALLLSLDSLLIAKRWCFLSLSETIFANSLPRHLAAQSHSLFFFLSLSVSVSLSDYLSRSQSF